MPKRYIRRPDGTLVEDNGVTVDSSLAIAGVAADAKAVGDKFDEVSKAIGDLKQNGTGGSGLTAAQISALDGMFKIASFTKDPTVEYTAFKVAFGIDDSGEDEPDTEKTLTSISATYSGGDVAVGTAVTALTGITVTATYSDGSTATVTSYTLNGTIAEGENTIAVSYGGKTTTITVTGVAESGGESTDGTEWTDGVPYEYTLVPNEYVTTEAKNDNGIKQYNGWSRTPFLPCKGVSSLTVTYIDSSKNKLYGAYACWYDADQKYITSFALNSANLSSVPTDACFIIISQSDAIMTNIASITPHA